MNHFQVMLSAALIAGGLQGHTTPAHAAAGPDPVDEPTARSDTVPAQVQSDPMLNEERTVENWFLCVSDASAREIVNAGETSFDKASAAYDRLNAQHRCGQMLTMSVKLETIVYQTEARAKLQTTIYRAEVLVKDTWQTGFVFSN